MHCSLHKVFRTSRALAGAAGTCIALSAASAFEGAGASIGSPVIAVGAPAKGMATVALDIRNYAALKFSGPTLLTGFPLADQGPVDLDVTRFDPFSSDAVLVVAGDGPERPLARPEIVLLKGQVHNHPGSTVFLGLSPTAMNGYITLDGRMYVLSSGPAGSGVPAVVYDVGGIPPGMVKIANHPCGTDALPVPPHQDARPGGGSTDATCKAVRIAIETDFEYTNGVFGGNSTNSAAYAATLLGAISEIYKRDFDVALEVSYLRVWTANTDPYSSTTVEGRLDELKNYWNANMSSVGRNLAHMLTGVGAGAGGVAYVGVLCPGGYSYGSSGWLGGYFPYPLVNNNGQNWDLMVVAHEVGHNFGAPHTHDMTPPVDGCGSSPQDCSHAYGGTIMSYCHACAGGMNNIVLAFHPRTISETVLPYVNGGAAGCLQIRQPLGFVTQPVAQNTPLMGAATFSVMMGTGGGPMSFRWNKGGVDLSDDAHITGSHTDTLVVSPVGNGDDGNYRVRVSNACGTVTSAVGKLSLTCYSNCDGSSTLPLLTANDFQCFLNGFAGGMPYANCDGSTTAPVLTANDFQCFLNAYAAGCT